MSAAGFFGSLYNFTVSTCRVINKNKNNLNMHRDYRVEEATACRRPSMSLPFRLQYLPIIMRVRLPFKKHDNHLSIFTDYFYVPFLFLFLTIYIWGLTKEKNSFTLTNLHFSNSSIPHPQPICYGEANEAGRKGRPPLEGRNDQREACADIKSRTHVHANGPDWHMTVQIEQFLLQWIYIKKEIIIYMIDPRIPS
jgi:hypothetical protein